MRIAPANCQHLRYAGMNLSASDRAEMERMESGRDPVDVMMEAAGDPNVMQVSDAAGNVLVIGGHSECFIWLVHTEQADALSHRDRLRVLRLLRKHLATVKAEAVAARPQDHYHFTNIVSVANTPHMKLLDHLGAAWGDKSIHRNGHECRQFFF